MIKRILTCILCPALFLLAMMGPAKLKPSIVEFFGGNYSVAALSMAAILMAFLIALLSFVTYMERRP